MTPHKLVKELVQRAGGEQAVARAMGDTNFQGTLYKFCHAMTDSPSRRTAERIAGHFKISVDAIYDERVAAREWARLGLEPSTEATPAAYEPAESPRATLQVREPAAIWPLDPWISPESWQRLNPASRAAVAWEAKKALDAVLGALPSKPPAGGKGDR